MKIIFFGSSQFAVPSLEALLASGHKVSCVVTQPDRKKGRGFHLEGTLVKALASKSGIAVYQPEVINTKESIKFLKDLSPDLFIVVSYGQILSREILEIPKIFSLNAHASLLPKYRGAAPISRAIINGDKSSGVTIMKMAEKMDAGPIILQEAVDIEDDDTTLTLEGKLSKRAAKLLIDSLKLIENKTYNLTAQEEDKVSLAPKLKKETGLINWEMPAQDINNVVRGCVGWPGAFTYYNGKLLKIYKARVIPSVSGSSNSSPGEIIKADKENIIAAAGKDNLVIEELQIEGKRRMRAEEFIAGHKIKPGEQFGCPTS
ncbi:MAG: methionyl-tRNA formyltransferase [Candidatus Omnitrophota bacterium]